MQWSSEGFIIGTRKHGETSLIIEVMTRDRGRVMGLVRGGRSRKQAAVLQPGNRIAATWRARLDEHLGMFTVDLVDSHAGWLMEQRASLAGFQLVAGHLRLLPERDPHPALFDGLELIIEHLRSPQIAGPLMVRFELRLLEELGFGLDLASCAATGATQDLIYVSPKSGRAVSRRAGAPWADRLLALPGFLSPTGIRECDETALADGFRLTGFFLHRDVWGPRGMNMPDMREAFAKASARALAGAA